MSFDRMRFDLTLGNFRRGRREVPEPDDLFKIGRDVPSSRSILRNAANVMIDDEGLTRVATAGQMLRGYEPYAPTSRQSISRTHQETDGSRSGRIGTFPSRHVARGCLLMRVDRPCRWERAGRRFSSEGDPLRTSSGVAGKQNLGGGWIAKFQPKRPDLRRDGLYFSAR